ncbi:SusD/RagB family nutrient-binding outer membrane lipoprotein [Hymenobacter sp. DG25A]|uniref:SusD/RagB family nutrient-binding outer membrane lipoprotein n=1 Tax=Hymenobacter sp. DG25A TaxID=1385663 RepID=UPI0006BC6511|nr:SusD/RagB family nutrient-binding outer membrane lipoprotein [Hymenobacter sp. DG25A]ALD20287.1 hypothetical protein AM218_02365 [Hymenobacter sp. DG25A]
MKKLLWLGIPALMLTASCVGGLDDDYNSNPKRATLVPGVTLVSSAERSLTRAMVSTNVNVNPFRLWVQQFAETTYPDESRYDFVTRQINNGFWNTLYRDVLRDLQEGKKLISADPLIGEAEKANQLAAIEVLEVYTWAVLVDNFGDVPYEEALDFNKPRPAYTDDKAIYDDIIKRLDKAIGMFNEAEAGFASGDLIYDGDVAAWKKFANSLKLRLALTISDVDPSQAGTMAAAAAPGVFTSNDDNADLTFDATTPNTNPLWEDLVFSGRTDFIATQVFLDALQGDPRRDDYFNPVKGTEDTYKGGVAGDAHSFSYSLPSDKLREPTFPGVLMSYAEVEFLLAEAAARGFAVGGTAAEHYGKGVVASIKEWGNSEADALVYLAAHPYNPADYKKSIGFQKWIALYGQPVENWKEVRRLDEPKLATANNAVLDAMPKRYTYPIPEQNLNTANYNAAKAAIGGDEPSTAVFWDKF